jgi:hypothetical protein
LYLLAGFLVVEEVHVGDVEVVVGRVAQLGHGEANLGEVRGRAGPRAKIRGPAPYENQERIEELERLRRFGLNNETTKVKLLTSLKNSSNKIIAIPKRC